MKLLKAFLMAILLITVVGLFAFFLMWLQNISVIYANIVISVFLIIVVTFGIYIMMEE